MEIQNYLAAYRAKNIGVLSPIPGAPRRLFTCKYLCSVALPRVQILEHEANACPKRPGMAVKAVCVCHDFSTNPSFCCFFLWMVCGVWCVVHTVECPLECGITGLWAEELEPHLSSTCPRRIVRSKPC